MEFLSHILEVSSHTLYSQLFGKLEVDYKKIEHFRQFLRLKQCERKCGNLHFLGRLGPCMATMLVVWTVKGQRSLQLCQERARIVTSTVVIRINNISEIS